MKEHDCVTQATQILPDVPRCSQMTPDSLRCSEMLPDAPRCSQMFPDAPGCPQMFPDALRWSQIPAPIPRSTQYPYFSIRKPIPIPTTRTIPKSRPKPILEKISLGFVPRIILCNFYVNFGISIIYQVLPTPPSPPPGLDQIGTRSAWGWGKGKVSREEGAGGVKEGGVPERSRKRVLEWTGGMGVGLCGLGHST